MQKFSQELSLMLCTILQNFKKFGLQVFAKNLFKFQKNQNFNDKFFLNAIPRPKSVINDIDFLPEIISVNKGRNNGVFKNCKKLIEHALQMFGHGLPYGKCHALAASKGARLSNILRVTRLELWL